MLDLQKVLAPLDDTSPLSGRQLSSLFQGLATRDVTQALEREQRLKNYLGHNENQRPVGRTTRLQLAKQAQGFVENPSDLQEECEIQITCDTRAGREKSLMQEQSPIKTLIEIEDKFVVEEHKTFSQTDTEHDSFVEHITSRSPAKPVTRIEDSVEALDKLEEALEAMDEAAVADRIASPEIVRRKSPMTIKVRLREKIIEQRNAPEPKSLNSFAPTKSKFATVRDRSGPKAPVLKRSSSMNFNSATEPASFDEKPAKPETETVPRRRFPLKRPASLLPPKEPTRTPKLTTVPTKYELPGDIMARKIKEQREARLARQADLAKQTEAPSVRGMSRTGSIRVQGSVLVPAPTRSGSVRIKSAKAPTTPSFELPGDALSRRKKEALEARLKAQEEEERKRREFKATPIRSRGSTLPRNTPIADSVKLAKTNRETLGDGSLKVSKRSSIVGAHRPSILEIAQQANASAPRAPGPAGNVERKPSTKFNGPSMSGLAMQRTVSSSDTQALRQRAKEIYNRDLKAIEDIEREKRDREAAAKRSREEAAERGRQASREWAERQRLKKMAEGDKGMGIGYGPGGQMGLRG